MDTTAFTLLGGAVEIDHPGRVMSAPVERERFTFSCNMNCESLNIVEGKGVFV